MPEFQLSLPIAAYSTFKDYMVLGGGQGIWCHAVFDVCMKHAALFPLGTHFWWELAGIICVNDSLSILQDEEHVFPVESRNTALSRILWTRGYGTVHQATS